ncbi:MAG: hypothetical protein K6L76_09415 [Agarilytica sp.]
MGDRKEPTISTYAISKEEAAASKGQQKGQPSARPRQAAPKSAPKSAARSPAARPIVQQKSSPVGVFALLIALLAGGAAGYSTWRMLEAEKMLGEADLRIADLEGKFEMSGDEANASSATMQAKLKWADSEIRKLWGVSYDTNRKAIETNKAAIAKASKATSGIDRKIKAATQTLAGDLRVASELVDAQQSSMESIEAQNAEITRDYQALVDKLNILDSNRKELERRIQTNEQAIEAIDAFRRNVNQQLLQIRGG